IVFIIVFFMGTVLLFSQKNKEEAHLMTSLKETLKSLDNNSEKTFKKTKKIEEKAEQINAKEVRLEAIRAEYLYHRKRMDFVDMMATAKRLYQIGISYNLPVYEAMAKNLLFETYAYNGLYEKAFTQLEDGKRILNKNKIEDYLLTVTKANIFISYSNYYLLKNNLEKQLKYIKLSLREVNKLPDNNYKAKSLYVGYSNLAQVFDKMSRLDSAKYYVDLSLSKYKGEGR